MAAKIYLVENYNMRLTQSLNFKEDACGIITLTSEDVFPQDKTNDSWKLCNELRSAISDPGKQDNLKCIKVTLTKHNEQESVFSNSSRLRVKLETPVNKLIALGEQNFSLQVKLANFKIKRNKSLHQRYPGPALISAGMQSLPKTFGGNGTPSFEDTFAAAQEKDWPFGSSWNWSNDSYYLYVEVTIWMNVHKLNIESSASVKDSTNANLTTFTRKILHEQISTDVTLVAGNKTKFGCHKIFLTGNSPVVQAMFQDEKFTEENKGVINIPEMSEQGVMALLAYLYYLDLSPAENDFNIAMELLDASEKYRIEGLKIAMRKLFIAQDTDWYKGAKALKLFLFARNIRDCADLKAKAVEILQMNHKELYESPEYGKLFAENPEAGMDLCSALLSVQRT